MEEVRSEQAKETKELLQMAYPLAAGEFISRHEFVAALTTIETKITNSELRQRNWVLAGCLAIILAFGGGYMSLVAKLDNLAQGMPAITLTLEERRKWMTRQDERDAAQDRALQDLSPTYEPAPYREAP